MKQFIGGAILSVCLVAAFGIRVWHFWFRPDLTEPELFWLVWPWWVSIIAGAIVGAALLSSGED